MAIWTQQVIPKDDLLNLLWVIADMNAVRMTLATESNTICVERPSQFDGNKDKLKNWAREPSKRGVVSVPADLKVNLSRKDFDTISFEAVLAYLQFRSFEGKHEFRLMDDIALKFLDIKKFTMCLKLQEALNEGQN